MLNDGVSNKMDFRKQILYGGFEVHLHVVVGLAPVRVRYYSFNYIRFL